VHEKSADAGISFCGYFREWQHGYHVSLPLFLEKNHGITGYAENSLIPVASFY
jgi:hypothetical protein